MSTNKVALITGGSRGLGKNMAEHLSRHNIGVILTYHSKESEAKNVVASLESAGVKAAALQFDAADIAGIDGFVQQVKSTLSSVFSTDKLDFLVNNAGVGVHAMIPETTEAQFDLLVNIHFKSVFFLTQKLLPVINDGGSIVNISSGLARFATPGYAIYGSLKAAIDMLTKYEAKELGERRIRVNSVAPGAIETDFGGGVVRDNPAFNKMISDMTALGRVGLPDDIGGVVAFLCSEAAGWMNAQRLEVSGGVHI